MSEERIDRLEREVAALTKELYSLTKEVAKLTRGTAWMRNADVMMPAGEPFDIGSSYQMEIEIPPA